MTLRAFVDFYVMDDFEELSHIISTAAAVHHNLQDLEAGAAMTFQKKAVATANFLAFLGAYPTQAVHRETLTRRHVIGYDAMLSDTENAAGIVCQIDGDPDRVVSQPDFGIMGPGSSFDKVWLTAEELSEVISTAFPDSVITNSVFLASGDNHEALHHVSVREQFMQKPSDAAPVPSGSAVSTDLTLALMQATVRMISAIAERQALIVTMGMYNELADLVAPK
jgi:hypothetical protein